MSLKVGCHGGLLCLLFPALLLAAAPLAFAGQPTATQPLILSGSSSGPKPAGTVAHATLSPWKPLFRGVELCEASAALPRPLQVRAVRIDLRDPTVDFLVTPSNGPAPKDVGGRTTSEFLADFKCQVAINGSVFDVYAKHKGDALDVEGLSLSRGDLYSPPNTWDALLISTNHRAWIAHAPIDTRQAFNGLSGFYSLLTDGHNDGGMRERHPRSAVGVSQNGEYLILMIIDGRQPGYSEGATTAETAEWMRKLGAYNALNLDGGGSSALVIQGTNGLPVVLNRPCGPPPGTERRVANHLGVMARPLNER